MQGGGLQLGGMSGGLKLNLGQPSGERMMQPSILMKESTLLFVRSHHAGHFCFSGKHFCSKNPRALESTHPRRYCGVYVSLVCMAR